MRGDRLLGEAVQLEHEGILLGLQLLHEPLVVLVEDLLVALHHALHLRGQRPGGARQLEVKVVGGEAEAVEQAQLRLADGDLVCELRHLLLEARQVLALCGQLLHVGRRLRDRREDRGEALARRGVPLPRVLCDGGAHVLLEPRGALDEARLARSGGDQGEIKGRSGRGRGEVGARWGRGRGEVGARSG